MEQILHRWGDNMAYEPWAVDLPAKWGENVYDCQIFTDRSEQGFKSGKGAISLMGRMQYALFDHLFLGTSYWIWKALLPN